jgi:hypothetical protein
VGPYRVPKYRQGANLSNGGIGESRAHKTAKNQNQARLYSCFLGNSMTDPADEPQEQTNAVAELRARVEARAITAKLTPAQRKLLDASATIFD